MFETYSESIPTPLLTPNPAVSGSVARLPIDTEFVLAIHRYFIDLKYVLSAGEFVRFFYSKFAGDLFQIMRILACNVSFENAAGILFLGLAVFVVGMILTGLGRRCRFFKAGIVGVRFIAFGL